MNKESWMNDDFKILSGVEAKDFLTFFKNIAHNLLQDF